MGVGCPARAVHDVRAARENGIIDALAGGRHQLLGWQAVNRSHVKIRARSSSVSSVARPLAPSSCLLSYLNGLSANAAGTNIHSRCCSRTSGSANRS